MHFRRRDPSAVFFFWCVPGAREVASSFAFVVGLLSRCLFVSFFLFFSSSLVLRLRLILFFKSFFYIVFGGGLAAQVPSTNTYEYRYIDYRSSYG